MATTDQHGAAQRDALLEAGVEEKYIYFDQLSGAKAAKERPGLSALLAFAREGDTVLVYRIHRLGRFLIGVLNTVAEMQERGSGSNPWPTGSTRAQLPAMRWETPAAG